MTLLTLELLGDSTSIAETTHTLDFPLSFNLPAVAPPRPGRKFDENFIRGLACSVAFSPLLSTKCLRGLVELGQEDKEDFVLMEWIVAIELEKRKVVKAIITIEMQDMGKKDGSNDHCQKHD